MVECTFPKLISVRVEDDSTEDGYAYDPAFLIHPKIAIILNSEFIEFYKVNHVEGEEVYDMVTMLDPWEIRNRNGLRFDVLVKDASTLSFGEFWDRYMEVF